MRALYRLFLALGLATMIGCGGGNKVEPPKSPAPLPKGPVGTSPGGKSNPGSPNVPPPPPVAP